MRNGTRKTAHGAGLFGVMLLGVMAVPASPHHSFAMYDQTTTRIMTGKLTRYIPGANHAQMMFQVIDDEGNTGRQGRQTGHVGRGDRFRAGHVPPRRDAGYVPRGHDFHRAALPAA